VRLLLLLQDGSGRREGGGFGGARVAVGGGKGCGLEMGSSWIMVSFSFFLLGKENCLLGRLSWNWTELNFLWALGLG
jgi:hypothetical protein